MTVKTRVTTQKFPFIDDNSRLEDNSEKTLGPALGNVLGLKLLVFFYRPATATRRELNLMRKLLHRFGDRVHFALYRKSLANQGRMPTCFAASFALSLLSHNPPSPPSSAVFSVFKGLSNLRSNQSLTSFFIRCTSVGYTRKITFQLQD